MLAAQIPEIALIGPPATVKQIDDLEAELGLTLPNDYRTLLKGANGISANLVEIYSTETVPERNTTYEVSTYAPGYLLIGSVNCFPLLLLAGSSSAIYESDWGDLDPDGMKELAPSLAEWIKRGCPDSALETPPNNSFKPKPLRGSA